MMTMRLSKRVPRGWETVTEQTDDFARVMALRDDRKRRVADAKAKDKTLFAATKIGETVYLSASGTLTELANVGICVACLGRGCGHCDGTGDCRHNIPIHVSTHSGTANARLDRPSASAVTVGGVVSP